MSIVAVTGARGFLGGHVAHALREAGHQVRRLGRDGEGRQRDLDEPRSEGATLASLLDGVDVVVHLAARTVDHPDTPLAAYLAPNVGLVDDLLHASRAAGVRRFLLASSRLAAAPGDTAATVDDSTPPTTPYGLSKRCAELVLAQHVATGALTGTALRIAQVVGPGDGGRGALARFLDRARREHEVVVDGPGDAVRDVLHVTDVAEAVVAAARVHGALPPVVHVGSGGGASVAEMAHAAARAAGLPTSAVVHRSVATPDRSRTLLDTTGTTAAIGWSPRLGLDAIAARRITEAP